MCFWHANNTAKKDRLEIFPDRKFLLGKHKLSHKIKLTCNIYTRFEHACICLFLNHLILHNMRLYNIQTIQSKIKFSANCTTKLLILVTKNGFARPKNLCIHVKTLIILTTYEQKFCAGFNKLLNYMVVAQGALTLLKRAFHMQKVCACL